MAQEEITWELLVTELEAGKDRLLTSGEVAGLFRVDPKTASRWATAKLVRSVSTPGGHHRFHASTCYELLTQDKGANEEEVGDLVSQ